MSEEVGYPRGPGRCSHVWNNDKALNRHGWDWTPWLLSDPAVPFSREDVRVAQSWLSLCVSGVWSPPASREFRVCQKEGL